MYLIFILLLLARPQRTVPFSKHRKDLDKFSLQFIGSKLLQLFFGVSKIFQKHKNAMKKMRFTHDNDVARGK